jgi:hypothetical protein
MNQSFEDKVEWAISHAIQLVRLNNDPPSHQEADAELLSIEGVLSSLDPALASADHIPRVRATRIWLAADRGDANAVIQLSDSFARSCPRHLLDFFNVANLRLRALHTVGRHFDEIREAREVALHLQGCEYVHLVAEVGQQHPGTFRGNHGVYFERLKQAIERLKQHGYAELPTVLSGTGNLERIAVEAATELRRVNRARALEVLRESGEGK